MATDRKKKKKTNEIEKNRPTDKEARKLPDEPGRRDEEA
jgi:hypothetical protein